MLLDSTLRSIEIVLGGAVTLNQLPFVVAYADHDAVLKTYVPAANTGVTNNATPVTMVAAPAAGKQRQIKSINIYQKDTTSEVVTVRYNDNATIREIGSWSLATGDVLQYDYEEGWRVIDINGSLKTSTVGGTGPTGPTGATGAQGVRGPQGDDGDSGEIGPPGKDGRQGIDGVAGASGTILYVVEGEDGDDGVPGSIGPIGPQGPQGPAGEQKLIIIDSDDGDEGQMGPPGIRGLDGAVGPAGATNYIIVEQGSGEDGGIGPPGRQGIDGTIGRDGSMGMPGRDGDDADEVLRTLPGITNVIPYDLRFLGVITPPTFGTNQANYNPTGGGASSIWRLSVSVEYSNIGGIAGGVDGRILFLQNVGTLQIFISVESAGSSAENRIAQSLSWTFSYYILHPGETFILMYDGTLQRWVPRNINSIRFHDRDTVLHSPLSPTILATDQNDYAPTDINKTTFLRLTASVAVNITGLNAEQSGTSYPKLLYIHNASAFAITLKDESASSTAINRFALNGDIILTADDCCILLHDPTTSRWRALARPGAQGIQGIPGEVKIVLIENDGDDGDIGPPGPQGIQGIQGNAGAPGSGGGGNTIIIQEIEEVNEWPRNNADTNSFPEFFTQLDVNHTLDNVATEQPLFDTPTSLSLDPGLYSFECLFRVTAMSATSGNLGFDLLGAGTAVFGSTPATYSIRGMDQNTPTNPATISGSISITAQAPAASIVSGAVNTAMFAHIHGVFRIATTGTIIPSITLVTAIATATVSQGSYFRCRKLSNEQLSSFGPWT